MADKELLQLEEDEVKEIDLFYAYQDGCLKLLNHLSEQMGQIQVKRREFWRKLKAKYEFDDGEYYVNTNTGMLMQKGEPEEGLPSVTIIDNTLPDAVTVKID